MQTVTKAKEQIKQAKHKRRIIRRVVEPITIEELRASAIQMLIPLGLMKVKEALLEEAARLTGEPYERKKPYSTWGSNNGSVYLGDQKVKVRVPRVRDRVRGQEVALKSYERLQDPGVFNTLAFGRVINGLSQRKYERAALSVPETFGISKSTISRKFVRASAKQLRYLMERDLSSLDIVAIFMDGKYYAGSDMIIAVGVTLTGEKVVLGFIEASTENQVVCRDFLRQLIDRGLNIEHEILFVIDGGKGLRKGIRDVFQKKAFIQRCQWHKRENVLRYLSEKSKAIYRPKLQAAYEQPTYAKAKKRLLGIHRELERINICAARSLEEGLEDTLTLHRLGIFEELGLHFKTTNCIETVNKALEMYTGRVTRWHHSDHRQRWIAAALVEIEPTMRKLRTFEKLPLLRESMRHYDQNQTHQTNH